MEKQVSALSSLVTVWERQVSGTRFPYGNLFQQAIDDFQIFSDEYQAYFKDLIEQKSYNPKKITMAHLQYHCMETLEGYWLALEQVVLQWQTEYYCHSLEEAYQQSILFLGNLNVHLPGTLIYFNKLANIRYLPFTRIPILGISYLFSGPGRWSALSHELGHYLFWNMGGDLRETRKLQNQLKIEAAQFLSQAGISDKQRDLVISWLEELFSDIVGARMDGLGFIKSSEEFIESKAGNESERTLVVDHHPPLIFRPLVWRQVLQASSGELPKPVRKFNPDARIKFCPLIVSGEGRNVSPTAVPGEKDFETVSAGELLPAVETLVNFLTEKLPGILTNIRPKQKKATAFQELKAFLEDEQQASETLKKKETYELLLQPRTFEGGDTHQHGLPSFHGWHELPTHSH